MIVVYERVVCGEIFCFMASLNCIGSFGSEKKVRWQEINKYSLIWSQTEFWVHCMLERVEGYNKWFSVFGTIL